MFKSYQELFRWAKENNKNIVLVATDVQVDFVTGALANPDAQKAVPRIVKLLNYAKKFGKNVDFIFTRDTHYDEEALKKAKLDDKIPYRASQEGRKLPIPHCIYGTNGWQIVPEIDIKSLGEVELIDKESFGYRNWKRFYLDPKNDIMVFFGFCTDICVVSNVLNAKAAFPEVEFFVIENCCAGLTPEKHNSALDVMRSCQVTVI